jgi:hypothetical protein
MSVKQGEPMILDDNEMSFIAAALEAAAEKYLEDAAAQDRVGMGQLAEQFRRQSIKAKKLAERIQSS